MLPVCANDVFSTSPFPQISLSSSGNANAVIIIISVYCRYYNAIISVYCRYYNANIKIDIPVLQIDINVYLEIHF